MTGEILVAGGGLGGLAAALGARRAGWEARVLEQSASFSEVGAGIQLGPNASALLRGWGLLQGELRHRVARPDAIRVRDARGGSELAALGLQDFELRYGAPYLTVHRADLQQALLQAAGACGVRLHTGARLQEVAQQADCVRVRTGAGKLVEAEALVAADGLWSRVREQVLGDGAPRFTGHLAYRGLVEQGQLPVRLRSREVTVWLAPRMHLVSYPVRGGDALNVVCLAEGSAPADPSGWNHEAVAADLHAVLAGACGSLNELVRHVAQWRLWALHDRAPVAGPQAMAGGRIALLGDAAHPMLPYLAQGAGMALEDAHALERVLRAAGEGSIDLPTALRRYALDRWQRCARVQRRSRRNAVIFHAGGALRLGRDVSLRLLGRRLLDLPWLYGAVASPA